MAAAERFPMKNQEKRLLVSFRLYQRVIVKREAGMKPASQSLMYNVRKWKMSNLQRKGHSPKQ
jgi:hypothetical protein